MTFSPSVFYHPSLPSTMDEARAMAFAGAPEGTIVQAGIQTAGRGRFGNQWVSPEGNLYMTLLLRPMVVTRFCAQLSFVVAVALAETLAGLGLKNVQLKWPNDVLVSGKKIAGILLEMESGQAEYPQFLLVGTGVNVGAAPDGAAAVSCASVNDVRDKLAGNISRVYADWRAFGFAGIREKWLEKAYGLGQPITARMAERTSEGVFEGIDGDGNLILQDAKGALRIINSGAVHFRMP